MRGRKPDPTAIQIAKGDPSKKGARKLREKLGTEPKAQSGLPDCPAHLTGRARDAWNFWIPELEKMDLDRRPDSMMLEGACTSYARAVEADLAWQKDGITIEEPIVSRKTGEVVGYVKKPHPAAAIANAAWTQVRSFCSEFGFSPVARTRLSTPQPSDSAEELTAILSKPREFRAEATVN